ncbi:hypothetical protein IFM89_012387 [Coptis chinensis]|uniref:Cyanobacterial aminoacyl-tRNA synthetase CAAD domain-containing protein n=1 Tax=Coptis chinensis TaxID=261450 RepID=A0A835HJT4_9MAGN|nr:hypothetical protein IFM89_012387 [Coptis chinensis]
MELSPAAYSNLLSHQRHNPGVSRFLNLNASCRFSSIISPRYPATDSSTTISRVVVYSELLQLDSENAYPILIYGSGALVALWLASAVVGAIDSIPVFPKLLELVGLAFTIWFASRYLIFKENRDELSTKFEELKQQIIGLTDD